MSIYKRGCNKDGANDTCSKCGKRGSCGVYWYKFMWQGRVIRLSTKQCNDKVARNMESAHRSSLAKGEAGFREKKPTPTLAEFIDIRFEPWAKATFEKSSPMTWKGWYQTQLKAIKAYHSLSKRQIQTITSEHASDFGAHRQKQGLQPSSVNSSLRVLRRVLKLAVEWGVIDFAPNIRLLRGEHHRDRVVTQDEESRYLASAPELLASVAAVLADTGLRPEECFRLIWECITFNDGKNGTLRVTHGKTAAARRLIPMTPRVRAILEMRWEAAGRPVEGWVWPAPTFSGHLESSSLKKQHIRAFKKANEAAVKDNLKTIKPFVLYAFRHTFLTRLGEAGCDAWTLAKIAGHSTISISTRYVHPSENAVMNAMLRLGGHKIGHSGEIIQNQERRQLPQTTVKQ